MAQDPEDDDDENESRKAWTMEMLMNEGDISKNMRNEEESMSEDEKKFLYARAVHSNHLIQYHMHQIIERQRVVDEYRNMMMEGMNLIPLESNLHKYDPVIISQIINMIEADKIWHRKTFESVMSNLQNMWMEGIKELETTHMHCTNNDKNNNEMDGVEVIDLCSVSQNKNEVFVEGKENTKHDSQYKSKHDAVDKMEVELRKIRSKSMTNNEKVQSAVMCWESTSNFMEEEPHEEQEKVAKKPVKKTEKLKHEEEHVKPTLHKGNRLKNSIEEFCWEREDNGSTLETKEPEQQQVVYITNLENGIRKNGTEFFDEKGPNEKKPAVRNRHVEEPSLNYLNHFLEVYKESGSFVDYIDDSLKGENKRNAKEDNYTNMDEEKEGKRANLLKLEKPRYHHDFPRKKEKMRKLWS